MNHPVHDVFVHERLSDYFYFIYLLSSVFVFVENLLHEFHETSSCFTVLDILFDSTDYFPHNQGLLVSVLFVLQFMHQFNQSQS